MKKFLITALTILMGAAVFASEIDVLPTMSGKSNVQDRVWIGTFQLVWNDLADKFVFGPVRFFEGNPQSANELNKQEFTTDDISSKSYYKYSGRITKDTKKTIEKGIKKKFNETSDILGQIDWTPSAKSFIIYAMLKKDFEFIYPFDKLGKLPFKNNNAEFFGINRSSDKELRNSVKVLFYNSPNDYAVLLKTKTNEDVYLYKTANTKPFNYLYHDMLKKQYLFEGNKAFEEKDELRVPNIKFFEEKQFEELQNKRIKGTQYTIGQAIETVKFEMNNQGVKLKSEAAITMKAMAMPSEEMPRRFYFDDTFVIFLKQGNKSKPYFALRVNDISKFQ